MAASILPITQAIDNYTIKKRDNEEKLIAKKAILELKAESDKIIESQKKILVKMNLLIIGRILLHL